MEYGFKPTTNGRELLVACAALGKGLDITRVAVGSGVVPEDVDLADVHALYNYVTDGSVGDRTHENDRLYMTVQYANSMNKTLPAFTIAEFMVYAKHPRTGEETDLLYGTLGSYLQSVPAYNANLPVSVFTFPLVIILSDKVDVSISAPAGLVTYDELQEASGNAVKTALHSITTAGMPLPDLLQLMSDKLGIAAMLEGEGAPTAETKGKANQRYTDTLTGDVYVCVSGDKESGYIWEPEPIEGDGAPTSDTAGKVGQRYKDKSTGDEYVCTAADADAGYTWVNANISGSGVPGSTTPGVVGQKYTDEDTDEVYLCIAADPDTGYVWVLVPKESGSGTCDCEVVSEEQIQEMVDGEYVPGSDDTASGADIKKIIDGLYTDDAATETADDGNDDTASQEDLEGILNGLYKD